MTKIIVGQRGRSSEVRRVHPAILLPGVVIIARSLWNRIVNKHHRPQHGEYAPDAFYRRLERSVQRLEAIAKR